ncbi:MAG: alcohol dehydrogenase catalytic domain-containing protein [Candidatus Methylomirabilis oxyfera]|nr:alcohol dehydrogenase catalytic domain-containing protein [Candidatus Methylomirabilis oxyfera]
MRVVQLRGPGIVELVDVTTPSIGCGELLLEMRACGLCGTDLAKIFGAKRPEGPVPLGHELVGVVRAVGGGVTRFVEGDRLAVAHHVPCGRCRYCLHGSEPMCPQFKMTNIDPGGFAELVRIPALQVEQAAFPLPAALPDEVGVFMEPLACALRAVKRSDVQAGDRIAVVGAGCMGLLVAQAVALRGARPICLDLREERLELARSLGIEYTLNVDRSDPISSLLELTQGQGIDGAILTVVSGPILEVVLGALRAGGRINLFADPVGPKHLPIDLGAFWRQELSLITTYSTTPAELGEAIGLLASGVVRVLPLVSHRLDLSRFEEGARLQRDGRATKVLFSPVLRGTS